MSVGVLDSHCTYGRDFTAMNVVSVPGPYEVMNAVIIVQRK